MCIAQLSEQEDSVSDPQHHETHTQGQDLVLRNVKVQAKWDMIHANGLIHCMSFNFFIKTCECVIRAVTILIMWDLNFF